MRIFALLTAASLLAGCAGSQLAQSLDSSRNAGPCPPSGALYDASRIVELADDGTQTFDNITYTGEIVGVRMFCRYTEDNPVRAELEIDFAFGRGEKGAADSYDYFYWVAVTRPSGKVLNKEWFTVSADFSDGPVTGTTDLIREIIIPRADETISAANFEVIVGFGLTEEQKKFNRDGRRFRLGAGQ